MDSLATPKMTSDEIISPCTRVCIIDQKSGLCRGCRRTLTEISYWASYTRTEKLAVLETIAQRPHPDGITDDNRSEMH